jgi:D-glycero-D-manno-heptose 1,7-bisphosphate phosphatase
MGTGKRAVFLDRDGVINQNVFNPETGDHEAPLTVADFALVPGTRQALQRLQRAGFLLFLVSNQPNYAKQKSSLDELHSIDAMLHRELDAVHVKLAATYYCFHHPNGEVPEYSGSCACRKPSPYFLLRASREFALDPARSWMVGDRTTDILCGQSAGVRTIRISPDNAPRENPVPDMRAPNLAAAAEIICGAGVLLT